MGATAHRYETVALDREVISAQLAGVGCFMRRVGDEIVDILSWADKM